MPYRHIINGASDLPNVVKAIHRLERYYLESVSTMLRLPMPHYRLTANCSFVIAQTLLTAIAGASTTLFRESSKDRKNFEGIIVKFYPWAEEPANIVKPDRGAEILYELFRCPFVHDLGVNLDQKTHNITAKVLRAIRDNKGLTWREIRSLERRQRRLGMAPTVVERDDGTIVMQIEPLYWGTRRLFERLTRDRGRMKRAEAFLAQYAQLG